MKLYTIALVYAKQEFGQIKVTLRHFVIEATGEETALGWAISSAKLDNEIGSLHSYSVIECNPPTK